MKRVDFIPLCIYCIRNKNWFSVYLSGKCCNRNVKRNEEYKFKVLFEKKFNYVKLYIMNISKRFQFFLVSF